MVYGHNERERREERERERERERLGEKERERLMLAFCLTLGVNRDKCAWSFAPLMLKINFAKSLSFWA